MSGLPTCWGRVGSRLGWHCWSCTMEDIGKVRVANGLAGRLPGCGGELRYLVHLSRQLGIGGFQGTGRGLLLACLAAQILKR